MAIRFMFECGAVIDFYKTTLFSDVADTIIDCIEEYGEIVDIQFFGGEQ